MSIEKKEHSHHELLKEELLNAAEGIRDDMIPSAAVRDYVIKEKVYLSRDLHRLFYLMRDRVNRIESRCQENSLEIRKISDRSEVLSEFVMKITRYVECTDISTLGKHYEILSMEARSDINEIKEQLEIIRHEIRALQD